MVKILVFCLFLSYIYCVWSLSIQIKNSCNETLCPAFTGVNLFTKLPINSPMLSCLNTSQTDILNISAPWAGRVWAKSGCNNNSTDCRIGDCGRENCNGLSSTNTTLAEFTIQNNRIWYDVSLVDGHTHPMEITFPGLPQCKARACFVSAALESNQSAVGCPSSNLWFKEGKSTKPDPNTNLKQIAGCLSNCSTLGTDAACCRGKFADPFTCRDPNPAFARACPQAYSFAFSERDRNVLVTCALNERNSSMIITFCPTR